MQYRDVLDLVNEKRSRLKCKAVGEEVAVNWGDDVFKQFRRLRAATGEVSEPLACLEARSFGLLAESWYVLVTRDSCVIWYDEISKTSKYRGTDLRRRYVSPETPRTTLVAELLPLGAPRCDSSPGAVGNQWISSRTRHCGGTAPKLAAVPALSAPAVLCRRNLCGRLDGLDDHLAAIVVSHAV
jgi:hypothetical protein